MNLLYFPFRPLGMLLTCLCLLAALNLQAQTIPNPSFELQNFPNYPGYASGNGGSITGWSTNNTNRVGVNTAAGPFVPSSPAVPDGSWAAFIQSDASTLTTLSTTITGLNSGVTYSVSFAAGQRSGYTAPAPTWSLNGGSAVSFAVVEGSYTTITGTFTATGSTASLVVTNNTATDTTLVMDHFQITALGPTITASTASIPSTATTLTITGTGFDTTPGNNTVVFTPAGTGSVTTATVTSLTVTSLSGLTAGALNAVVTTNGVDSGAAVQVATVIVNTAPTLTSNGGGAAGSVSIAENATAVTTVTATDPEVPATQTLTYSKSGADAAFFTINSSTGDLTFTSAPDYESPADAGGNNVYDVTVTVTDNGVPNLSDSQDLAVTVTNVNEAPGVTGVITQLAYETVNPTRVSNNIVYSADNGAALAGTSFNRVRYRMELTVSGTPYYAETSFDAWSGLTVAQLKVPDQSTPLAIQRNVTNLSVDSNYPGVVNAAGQTGRLEIWPSNYTQAALGGVGGSSTTYDFDDSGFTTSIGHGSFQVHNLSSAPPQTVLAWNNHASTTPDMGFGNQPTANPDWTFANLGKVGWKLQISIETAAVPGSFGFTEDVSGNLLFYGTPFTDPDSATLTVTLAVADGTITGNAGTGVTVGGSATARTFTGATSDLNAYFTTAGKVTYLGALNNNTSRTLTTTVSDGTLSTDTLSTISFTAVNDAPVITSNGGGASGSLSVPENTTAVTTVTATDIDLPAQTLTFTKSGADASFFTINSSTGVLAFAVAPNFEIPLDAGGDNVYNVTVTATDNGSPLLSGSQDLAVTVTYVSDGVQFSGGTTTLTGSNSATGPATISSGTLILNRTAGDNTTISTDGIAGNTDITLSGGTLQILQSEQIGNNAGIVLNSGTFNFGAATGRTETIGFFTNNGGTFTTGANALVGTGASVNWNGGTNTVSDGGLVQDSHVSITDGINTVQGGASGGVLEVLSGGAGLEFGGTASPTLTLNSDNAVAGKLLLSGDVTVLNTLTSGTAQILGGAGGSNPGTVDLNGGTRLFTVNDGSAATDLLISAQITNGALTKAGAGTLALTGATTYTGTTTVDNGTLAFSSASTVALSGGLTFGATNATTTTGSLDLTNASATFAGAMLVQTDSASANTITIGAGKTLTTNGNVTIGAAGTGSADQLTVSGSSGAWVVGGGTTFNVGGSTSTVGASSTLDMSALGSFTAGTVATPLTLFKIGSTDGGTIGDANSVLLAATATISATTMDIGSSTVHTGTQALSIGTGSGASKTTFNVNTLSIGSTSGKGSGIVNFADASLGEIKIRAADGTSAAALNIVNSTSTSGAGFDGSLLLAGHSADVLASTLTIASRIAGGSWTNAGNSGTLTFDTGTFNATTVVLSSRGGATATTGGTNASATFGGGTVTLGTVTMSTNSATTNTSTGSANSTLTFNGSGTNSITTLNMGSSTVTGTGATGVVTNGTLDLSGTAVTTIGTLNMAVNAATAGAGANTAQSTINLSAGTLHITGNISMGDSTVDGKHSYNNAINLTGGTLTVDGNITRSATVAATTGTYASTITLDGGILDMTNGSIGGANAITLNAMSGTLQNLADINAGGALTKTGTGTLIMAGTNTYTGATTITAGTLQVDGSLAAGSTVNVGTSGKLTGSGTVNGNATLTGNGIINNTGTIVGTLDVTGGNWNGAGSVTGLVTSSSGTFTIGSGASLTADGGLSVNGGTLANGDSTSTITGNVSYTSASSSSFGGVIAGSGKTLTLNNAAATLTLSGTNSYTGATTLSAGSLIIDGSIATSSLLTLNGGTLLGTGAVGALQLNSSGVINAGAVLGAGTLTTGSIAITDGQLVFNIGAAGAHNQINTNGTLNLANGGSGAQLVLNSISGYSATLGDSFTLVSNDLADAITGAFAKGTFGGTKVVTLSGVDYVEGLLGSSYYGKISYDGGTGNDLTLTVVTPLITITESGSNVAHASTYDFGSVDKVTPAQTLTKTFTIKNDGGVDLMGISVNAPTGAAAADYLVDTSGTASVLAPGASTTFTITFSPGALGTRSAAITIDSNDLTKNPFNLALTGVGSVARDLNLAWVQSYGGPTAPGTRTNGDAKAVAVYKVGGVEMAVCATGYTTNAAGNKDIYTACYDPADGTLLWEKLLNGAANGADEGFAVAVDSCGNVIVTGYTTNADGTTDVITAKYAQADGTLLWQKIYNGAGNSYDVGLSVTVDVSGNVAVAGYGVNATAGMDVFAARYSANGSAYFELLVDGGGNGTDQALAVATDSAGDVVLTGFRTQSGAGKDLLVLKLNASSGATTWIKTVNGSSNTEDIGYALAVDGSDAVIVTGSVRGVNYDFYTLKLSSAGAELWSRQWNSSYDSSDAGFAVALDSQGDVIVAGHSYTAPSVSDGYVAKYSGSTGTLLWDYRYNGADLMQDGLAAVAVDGADNVIATGYTQKTDGSYDAVTLKLLSGDGGLLWTQLYDGTAGMSDIGRALAVTTNGQTFVAGYSAAASTTDFLVFSYLPKVPATQAAQAITFANPGAQSAGTPLTLVATADSGLTVHFAVVSGSAEIDGDSNTLLTFTGSGSVTVRATQSGSSTYATATPVDQTFTVNKSAQTISFALPATLSSTAEWPLTGVATSGLAVTYSVQSGPGTIVGGILSFSGAGDVTVRASQAGDGRYNAAVDVDAVVTAQNHAPIVIFDNIMENWRDTYAGTGEGVGNDIALQLSGNDAIAGFVAGYTTGTDKDLYLVKYLADGTLDWSVTSGISGNDEAMSVLVDGNGDVIVAGYVTTGTGQDIYVAKHNGGTGAQIWSYTYNGPGNGNDVAVSLGLDGATNVVVGGYAVGSGTSYDFFAAKLNLATGAVVWASLQNRTGTTSDVPARVAVGSDGSVALAGVTNSDAWTVKLDAADGTRVWQVVYNYANKPDAVRGLAFDAANNVYIGAQSQGANYDMYTAKYSALDGTLIWGKRYNSSFNSSDHPWDIAVDEDSNVYVTGASYRAAGKPDGMTLKYAGLDGTLLWEGRFNGTGNGNDENLSISLDGIGNPVISGYTTNADGTTDVYLAKHDKSPGTIRWQNTFDGANNKNDSIKKVKVDPNGNVWMAGSATTTTGTKQVLVLRDIPTP